MHENAFFFCFLLHFYILFAIMYIAINGYLYYEGRNVLMGTYNLPRNVKGEGRILFIFSGKSLIYSAIGGGIGLPFYFIFAALKLNIVGIIVMLFLTLIGFAIGTFKIPEIGAFKFTKKVGGEGIDDVIKRIVKFRKNGNKIYLYTKEEEKNG